MRRLDRVLEVAARGRRAIARPPIGPGAAARFGLTRLGAGLAVGAGRGFEGPVIAADTIDRIFELAQPRLDDAGAVHARNAAARFNAPHHFALEPAHGRATGGRRIGKAPGPAVLVVLAARRAHRRVAVGHGARRVIAARPVVARLRRGRRDARNRPHRRADEDGKTRHECSHAPFSRWLAIVPPRTEDRSSRRNATKILGFWPRRRLLRGRRMLVPLNRGNVSTV